ncbi:hypothetical protein Gotur_016382, partial [Gossypium turneri]
KKIQKKLKIRGYSLKTDGLDEILSFVNRFQDAEDEAIDLLLDQLDHQSSVKSSVIDKEAVHQVFMVGQLSTIQSLVGQRGRRWVSSTSWRKFEILANTYGTAMPLKMDLDRQILSRYVSIFMTNYCSFNPNFKLGTRKEKKRLAMENSSFSSELQKLIEAIKFQ